MRYQQAVYRIFALLALSFSLAAETPEETIKAADVAWSKAVIQRDYAALNKIYSADLLYAHSTGNIETREEYIERLKGGKQRYDKMTFEKTRVMLHGNTALTHSIVRFEGKNDSGAFNDHLMMMHFWVKNGKNWVLQAHQTTRIP
ncbi:nuclear transport factor 2 family protein [Bryobacter aggregatus]|uniref:nuclear transport factor 2 family protein n=1 Tax=Bryobacter aggregatus TaxID=360054 RepID=UPI0009B5A9D4|nr:nuclear transport factor 2 family protein [Bryobacter aggregatus]